VSSDILVSLKILIVDDHALVRHSLRSLIERTRASMSLAKPRTARKPSRK